MAFKEINMKIKRSLLLFFFLFLTGCSVNNLSDAEFTNVTPAEIRMNNVTYFLTDELLTTDEVNRQIGEITKVNAIVSYTEEQNPYRKPNKIFEVKDIKIEDAIAVQVNGRLYKAKK